MQKVLVFVKAVLLILLGINLFMWMVFNGSGHKIPVKTNWTFAVVSLIIAAVLLVVIVIKKRLYNNVSKIN
jgi:hypothetical protein